MFNTIDSLQPSLALCTRQLVQNVLAKQLHKFLDSSNLLLDETEAASSTPVETKIYEQFSATVIRLTV